MIATLAPQFSAEREPGAADPGLLAGVYFPGFASMQRPLGRALGRCGPKRVQRAMPALAAAGCVLDDLQVARPFAVTGSRTGDNLAPCQES